MLAEMTRANKEIYNEKIRKRAHSVHNSKVIRTCLSRGKIFENVGFPKETRKKTSVWRLFGIIHVECYVRLYLTWMIPNNLYI